MATANRDLSWLRAVLPMVMQTVLPMQLALLGTTLLHTLPQDVLATGVDLCEHAVAVVRAVMADQLASVSSTFSSVSLPALCAAVCAGVLAVFALRAASAFLWFPVSFPSGEVLAMLTLFVDECDDVITLQAPRVRGLRGFTNGGSSTQEHLVVKGNHPVDFFSPDLFLLRVRSPQLCLHKRLFLPFIFVVNGDIDKSHEKNASSGAVRAEGALGHCPVQGTVYLFLPWLWLHAWFWDTDTGRGSAAAPRKSVYRRACDVLTGCMKEFWGTLRSKEEAHLAVDACYYLCRVDIRSSHHSTSMRVGAHSRIPIYHGPRLQTRELQRSFFLANFFHASRDVLWARICSVLDVRDKLEAKRKKTHAEQPQMGHNDASCRHAQMMTALFTDKNDSTITNPPPSENNNNNNTGSIGGPDLSLLLHGPPGNGKTRFALVLGGLVGADVGSIDIVGFSQRAFLHLVEENTSDIVLFDELDRSLRIMDQFAQKRLMFERASSTAVIHSGGGCGDSPLNGMEGIGKGQASTEPKDAGTFLMGSDTLLQVFGNGLRPGGITVATTNDLSYFTDTNPDGKALIRPGRFEPFHMPTPTVEVAEQIALAILPLTRADEAPKLARSMMDRAADLRDADINTAELNVVLLLRAAEELKDVFRVS